jgi:hypothetical protein
MILAIGGSGCGCSGSSGSSDDDVKSSSASPKQIAEKERSNKNIDSSRTILLDDICIIFIVIVVGQNNI